MVTILQKKTFVGGTLFFFLLLPGHVRAFTIVDTPSIAGDTTWAKQGSPYIIPVQAVVPAGSTLTIEPGVVVKFDGPGNLTIQGNVHAVGNSAEEIIFTTVSDSSFGGDTTALATTTPPQRFVQNQILVMSGGDFTLVFGKLLYNGFALGVDGGGDNIAFRPMIENQGTLTITDSTIQDGLGSGLQNYLGDVVLRRSTFQNLPGDLVHLISGSTTISEGIFKNGPTGIRQADGILTVASSTLQNLKTGIHLMAGSADIIDSRILHMSDKGILEDGGVLSFTHGYIEDTKKPGITVNDGGLVISQSSILNVGQDETFYEYQDPEVDENGDYTHPPVDLPESGVNNYGSLPVGARNNWWGDPAGPDPQNLRGMRTSVGANIHFTPWLPTENIDTATTSPSEPSNILFLPGISGSRLYQKVFGIENQRWEPSLSITQSDVRALGMDASGNSINAIYVKEGQAVDSFTVKPTTKLDIYRTFFGQLARLKAEGKVADYLVFPYDWRKSPIDVAEGANDYEDGARYLSEELEKLSGTSLSGKVTIAGHSNGGLVAKALMKKLERLGKASLVDKVILVDSPQLGAPNALAPILHGDYGALTSHGGLLISQENMRNLAHNMPDAYALLPGDLYLYGVTDPVIDLTDAPKLALESGVSSTTIGSNEDYIKFITGTGGRAVPASDDVETPNTLSSFLSLQAAQLHQYLDDWQAPVGVKRIEIAGWGLDTVKGIKYTETEKTVCSGIFRTCSLKTFLTHQPMMTTDGDGTVVLSSQVSDSASDTFYINLRISNKERLENHLHADVTESKAFQDLFNQLVGTSSVGILPNYVLNIKPIPELEENRLRLRVLSPVSLDAYDDQGRHTGMLTNPYSDMLIKEEQIPNSYYQEYGEGKYLGLGGTGTSTILLKGLGTGTFTFEATSIANGTSTTIVYRDIPVTSSTSAQIVIQDDEVQKASLSIDTNGDGKTDTVVASSTQSQSPLVYVRLMRSTINAMDMGATSKRQLMAKLYNVETLIKKDGKWEDADDDKDKSDIQKGGRPEERSKRKLGKIETWITKQLQKPQTTGKKNNDKSPDQLSTVQAEAILNMIHTLRNLIK